MIINMPHTDTRGLNITIDDLHKERGESATGRVLTLIIDTDHEELENALKVANAASREHPCRVIAVVHDSPADSSRTIDSVDTDNTATTTTITDDSHFLDAQVRFGADAGAGEIIILHPQEGLLDHLDTLVIPLLVPDAPVVTWWPKEAPENPAQSPLGAIARNRITDALRSTNPYKTLENLQKNWSRHDVDLSWTRLTMWRAILASMLDQNPRSAVTAAKILGAQGYLPLHLLQTWLENSLEIPVEVEYDETSQDIKGVYFKRADGTLSLTRTQSPHAVMELPHSQPQSLNLPTRSLADCMREELGHLTPDLVYAEVLSKIALK